MIQNLSRGFVPGAFVPHEGHFCTIIFSSDLTSLSRRFSPTEKVRRLEYRDAVIFLIQPDVSRNDLQPKKRTTTLIAGGSRCLSGIKEG